MSSTESPLWAGGGRYGRAAALGFALSRGGPAGEAHPGGPALRDGVVRGFI